MTTKRVLTKEEIAAKAAKAAEAKAKKEAEAAAKAAAANVGGSDHEVEVIVTQARLDAHLEEYTAQEIGVGDVIAIPENEVEAYDEFPVDPAVAEKEAKEEAARAEADAKEKADAEAKAKKEAEAAAAKAQREKSGDVAVLENGNFMRRFTDVAQAEAVASKGDDPNSDKANKRVRTMVPMADISAIVCEYEYLDKKNNLVHQTETFSEKTHGPSFPEQAVIFNNEKRGALKIA